MNAKVNSNGVNKLIKYTILPDEKMKEIGFCKNYYEGTVHEKYSPYLMMVRNKYMVDISDRGIAVWDGSKGGTANCVRYAQKIGKPLDIINPAFIGDGINV